MRLTLDLACILLLVSAATPRPAQQLEPTQRQMDIAPAGRTGAPQAGDTTLTTEAERHAGSSYGAPLAAVTRSGWATYCAPTPRYCQRWGGKAMLGAVPSFRYGDEPYTVQVTAFENGKANAILVTVVSYCACGPRRGIPTVIDLSPFAFQQLAPLSKGVIRVVVDGVRSGPLSRAVPLAPQTDVTP